VCEEENQLFDELLFAVAEPKEFRSGWAISDWPTQGRREEEYF
jgi:hypothetical protein